MKILVGSIPMPMNRFLVDLNQGLSNRADLVHDPDVFWNMEGDFDVVHLHFPEYTTYELQDAYRDGLTDELISQTEERLKYWSQRSSIVVTRHVLLPHDALKNPQWEKIYELTYRYASGVVHFAQASIDEFRTRYRETDFVNGEPEHSIVPHHNYASLPNEISRQDARRKLGIPASRKVMLVFGSIRSEEELQLIQQAFDGVRHPQKHLLVSKWRETLPHVSWIRLKYWLRDLKRFYHRLHPRHSFFYDFVAEEDAQLFLNAADVLFIPRFRVLNSGNVTLGMTFGKVVVGPDSWDVGELLREQGHATFDPGDTSTASLAVDEAFGLEDSGQVGTRSQTVALTRWSAQECADRYIELFQLVRGSTLGKVR